MARLEMQKSPYLKDFLYTVLFGMLSIVLSKIQFHIPGVGDSNLREIPLLICLFHISNPLFVFLLSLFTLFGSSADVPSWIAYGAHLLPLFAATVLFRILGRWQLSNTVTGVLWMLMTIGYYLLLLLPLIVLALSWLSKNDGESLWVSYQSILFHIRFEVITSSLVTGLYLMQLEIRKTLESSNKNLEQIVVQRTKELTTANNDLQSLNEELTASNEGIKQLNESLEDLVKERTLKINEQLNQLRKYAYMNSHELRAPLARMLGLLQLIRHEQDADQMKELLRYLHDSSNELDNVIREMNRLLEKEISFDKE